MTAPKATGQQVRERASRWLQQEIERSRHALGPTWPMHAAWVMDYLRAELAERLRRWQ